MDLLVRSHLRLGERPVLITAVCPGCKTSYQVQDSLRGKPMRCPQPTCRTVFVVDDPAARPASQPAPGQQTGSVGEVIPLLPVEDAPPAPPREAPHVGDLLELLPAEAADPPLVPLTPD